MSLRSAALTAAAVALTALSVAGCRAQPAPRQGVDHEPISAPTGGDVVVPAMPANLEAFRAWRDQVATTPEGGAAAFVVAMLAYAKDPNTGLAWITVQTDRKFLAAEGTRGPRGYKGMRPAPIYMDGWKRRIAAKPYIARNYVLETSPANGYAVPQGQFTIGIRRVQEQGNGQVKVWVHATGADSARPVRLSMNSRGIWKAYEWSSLQVGCRPPQRAAPKDDF